MSIQSEYEDKEIKSLNNNPSKIHVDYEKLHMADSKQFTTFIPYKCPVCEGRGVVRHGFYIPNESFCSTSIAPEKCRTCHGRGIIWG